MDCCNGQQFSVRHLRQCTCFAKNSFSLSPLALFSRTSFFLTVVPFAVGSHTSVAAWFVCLFSKLFSFGWVSELCFGFATWCRDPGGPSLVLPRFLGACVCVSVKFRQYHISFIYYYFYWAISDSPSYITFFVVAKWILSFMCVLILTIKYLSIFGC
jgi:hypothetical protein